MPTIPQSRSEVVASAQKIMARLNPGPRAVSRSLPIRGAVGHVREQWDAHQAEILDGIPSHSAQLSEGADQGDWGTTWTLRLQLDAPLPAKAGQLMAGKAVRRLKSLTETGEM